MQVLQTETWWVLHCSWHLRGGSWKQSAELSQGNNTKPLVLICGQLLGQSAKQTRRSFQWTHQLRDHQVHQRWCGEQEARTVPGISRRTEVWGSSSSGQRSTCTLRRRDMQLNNVDTLDRGETTEVDWKKPSMSNVKKKQKTKQHKIEDKDSALEFLLSHVIKTHTANAPELKF